MLWLVYVGLCLFFSVSFTLISRVSMSTTTKYTSAYTVLWEVLTGLMALPLLPFSSGNFHVDPRLAIVGIVSLILYTISNFFIFTAFKYEEASVLSVILPINNIFTFLATILIFKAVFTNFTVAGIVLILLAILLSQFFQHTFRISKGSAYGLLFAAFIGLALAFDAEVVKTFSVVTFIAAGFLVPAVLNQFVFLRPSWHELKYELTHQTFKLLLNAASQCLSTFFLYEAFTVGSTLQVVSVFALSTILTTLAGIIFLKERDHIPAKLASSVLATVGIILINH